MGAQQFRRAAFVDARRPCQLLEKAGHGEGIVTGACQRVDADAIGLLFVSAGEVDLFLGRETLHTGHGGDAGAWVDRGPEHRRGEHQRHGRNRHLLLHLERAHQVLLAHVCKLVRDNGREFRLGLGGQDQPGVDADVSGRSGKCIDAWVVDNEKVVIAGTLAAGRRKLIA